jgi:hypothetical protein
MATVTREQALCAAQKAMNMLLLAAGVTCDGKPVITKTPTGSDIQSMLLKSAREALTAADIVNTTDELVATAAAAVQQFSEFPGANKGAIGTFNTALEKARAKLASKKKLEKLLEEANGAVLEAETAHTANKLTKSQRDAAARAVAAYESASGHNIDELGLLTARLNNIPKIYPGPASAGINAKLAEFTADLGRLVAEAESFDRSSQLLAPLGTIYNNLRAKQTESDNYISGLKDGEYDPAVLAETKAIKAKADGVLKLIEDLTISKKADVEAIREEVALAKTKLVPISEYDSNNREHREALADALSVAQRWNEIESNAAFFIEGRPETTDALKFKTEMDTYRATVNAREEAAAKEAANAALIKSTGVLKVLNDRYTKIYKAGPTTTTLSEIVAFEPELIRIKQEEEEKIKTAITGYESDPEIKAQKIIYDEEIRKANEALEKIKLYKKAKEEEEKEKRAAANASASSSGSGSGSSSSGSLSGSSPISKEEVNTEEDLNTAIEELALLSGGMLTKRKLYLNAKVDSLKLMGDKSELHTKINEAVGKQTGGRRRTRRNKRKAKRTTRRS